MIKYVIFILLIYIFVGLALFLLQRRHHMLRALTGTQAHQLRQQFSRQPLQRRSLSLLTKATALPQRSLNRPRLTPPMQAARNTCTVTQFFKAHGHETTTSIQKDMDDLQKIHHHLTQDNVFPGTLQAVHKHLTQKNLAPEPTSGLLTMMNTRTLKISIHCI